MSIVATDWADFYGGREENFLMQQMRNLADPGNGSVARGSPLEAKVDPTTGHLVGMDTHYVTSDRVGDRVRFHLHRRADVQPSIFD
jgi:hypothetical protein